MDVWIFQYGRRGIKHKNRVFSSNYALFECKPCVNISQPLTHHTCTISSLTCHVSIYMCVSLLSSPLSIRMVRLLFTRHLVTVTQRPLLRCWTEGRTYWRKTRYVNTCTCSISSMDLCFCISLLLYVTTLLPYVSSH